MPPELEFIANVLWGIVGFSAGLWLSKELRSWRSGR